MKARAEETNPTLLFGRFLSLLFSSTTDTPVNTFDECFQCERIDSCSWGDCPIPVPLIFFYAEQLWEGLLAFAATLEVLVRGFTLGFGVRMMKYLFWDDNDEDDEAETTLSSPSSSETTTTAATTHRPTVKSFRRKALVSAISGLSLAAFLHESSLFVPAQLREKWLDQTATPFDSFKNPKKTFSPPHRRPRRNRN